MAKNKTQQVDARRLLLLAADATFELRRMASADASAVGRPSVNAPGEVPYVGYLDSANGQTHAVLVHSLGCRLTRYRSADGEILGRWFRAMPYADAIALAEEELTRAVVTDNEALERLGFVPLRVYERGGAYGQP